MITAKKLRRLALIEQLGANFKFILKQLKDQREGSYSICLHELPELCSDYEVSQYISGLEDFGFTCKRLDARHTLVIVW